MPQEKSIPRTCPQCGETFLIEPFRLKTGRGKHCSVACASAARRTWPDRDCAKCGKTFRTRPGKVKYCSDACYRKGRFGDSDEDRFWAKVEKTDGCWLWKGCLSRFGYGTFLFRGKGELAHRVAWAITHGAPPEQCLLHRCDNPACVRPDHLFPGTQKDNALDREMKGRGGDKSAPKAPDFTPDQVRRIRELSSSGVPGTQIASQFGVSPLRVYFVIGRRTYKNVI